MIAVLDAENIRTKEEYSILMAAFIRLLDNWDNSAEKTEILEDIISSRSSFLIDRALSGMSIEFDQALSLLRNHNTDLTDHERSQRDILISAVNNLVDFAVASEFTMLEELPSEIDADCYDEYEKIFKRYNLHGATQENADVFYSAAMAAWWITLSSDSYITFMTQGDERVRSWHLAHEGRTYRKRDFPPELIPPIEWGCRCFLLSDSLTSVRGELKKEHLETDPVFRESLATGGRIFSNEHTYFKTKLPPHAIRIAERIKNKLIIR